MYRTLLLISAAAVAACGDGGRRATPDSARGDVTSRTDTSMAGMDHANMPGMADSGAVGTGDTAAMDHTKMPGMGQPSAGANATPAVDHSKMPGMGGGARDARPMAGMDHASMPGMTRTPAGASRAPMAGMDHANMPGMSRPAARGTAPAQVDHANMPGMVMPAVSATPVSAGDLKLDSLVSALLNDPAVRQRIQSDSNLKRRWDQAARRTILLDRPE